MNETASVSTRSVIAIRWVARIIGMLAMAAFLFFFVADCIEKGEIAVGSNRILMTVFLLLSFIGLIIAWKREGIGGALALVGLPSLLFVYCSWLPRKQAPSQDT